MLISVWDSDKAGSVRYKNNNWYYFYKGFMWFGLGGPAGVVIEDTRGFLCGFSYDRESGSFLK
jgi:hypothetical protein